MNVTSYWADSIALPAFDSLDGDREVDVAVVGAGITGITTAYLAKRAGYSVALIDRRRGGGWDTSHTTAHLTCVTDSRLRKLVKVFGRDQAKATWDAGRAAIDQIVTNIRTEGIDCGFQWTSGYLHAPVGSMRQEEKETLAEEAELAKELGFPAEYTHAVPSLGAPGIQFKHQAKFHPLQYLAALLKIIPGGGSSVHDQTEAEEIESEPLAVKAGGHRIRCRHIVLATHTPLMGKSGLLSATLFQSKLFLYTTYAVGARIPKGRVTEACYWDTAEPYRYLRIDSHPDFDYAIYGGEDHKTGQREDTVEPYERLEADLSRLVGPVEVTHRWSGQVVETADGLPYIGETAEQQFAATGFAGNGMTFGTLGAMMAIDAVRGQKNPWAELFDPHRKKLRGGAWDYLKENKDYPYYMVRDRLGGVEGKSLAEMKPGEGMILRLRGRKVAAYRAANGEVSLCSPVCTHLKCIVAWNSSEQTWDCPCHGSRFTPQGEVISGPAEEALEPIPLEDVQS